MTSQMQERDERMDYNTLPVGLGLAFANNRAAMDRFVDMTDDEKDEEPDLHLENVNQIFKGPGIG